MRYRRPAPRTWQVQEAKARFSELFQRSRSEGPQRVFRHGKESVVVLRQEEYDRLLRRRGPGGSLAEFFARSPLARWEVRIGRERGKDRPVGL